MKEKEEKPDNSLCIINICTFIGGYFEKGAWPWASSNAVIPKDQISALQHGVNKHQHPGVLIGMKLNFVLNYRLT